MLIWIQSTSLKCWNASKLELVFKPKEVWPQLPYDNTFIEGNYQSGQFMGKFNEVQQWKDLRMIEVNPFALRDLDNFMLREMIEWVTSRKDNDEFEKVGQ